MFSCPISIRDELEVGGGGTGEFLKMRSGREGVDCAKLRGTRDNTIPGPVRIDDVGGADIGAD